MCGTTIRIPTRDPANVPKLADELPPLSTNSGLDDLLSAELAAMASAAAKRPDPVQVPPSQASAPMPSRTNPMPTREGRSARNVRSKGPSMFFLGIGGVLLIAISAGVTLWATHNMPKLGPNAAPQSANTNVQVREKDSANLNLAIFDLVHRAVAELRAAQDVGMNRERFQGLLQQFSTEVIMATEKAQSPAEKTLAEGYRQVLEIYKDSAKIWDVKLSIPTLKHDADKYVELVSIAPNSDAITENYNFQVALIDGIPLDVFPKGGTGLEVIVNRYSIPVVKKEGYRIIAESSIQLLWQKAGERMEQVNKLRKN